MNHAFIAVGSNLEHPVEQVCAALHALQHLPGSLFIQHSSLYQTKPVGYEAQPDFINAVVEIHTHLTPDALLDALLKIETKAGRQRSFRYGPRTLDLDLLLYNNVIMDSPTLTLPHPRMHERAFVMIPLAEITTTHDVLPSGQNIHRLAATLTTVGLAKLHTLSAPIRT